MVVAPARIWRIYVITHRESGRKYVGQTTKTVEARWKKHCSTSSCCTKLKNAIQKYGPDAFSVEHIASCRAREDADAIEIATISEVGSTRAGFNITRGGEGFRAGFCINGHDLAIHGGVSGCAICVPARKRAWAQKKMLDPEYAAQHRAKKAKYRLENQETLRAAGRVRAARRRAEHKAEISAAKKRYRQTHKSQMLAKEAVKRAANRERMNMLQKLRLDKDRVGYNLWQKNYRQKKKSKKLSEMLISGLFADIKSHHVA